MPMAAVRLQQLNRPVDGHHFPGGTYFAGAQNVFLMVS
jgi:hypothetical protein